MIKKIQLLLITLTILLAPGLSFGVSDGFVQLPSDAANTGKMSATVIKTDGANTVHVGRSILEDASSLYQAGVTSAGALKIDGTDTTQPVSGTFWQATQPVSGTFWQSTQPVSIASMPSTPVTGTFWQSTQPVSIASMPTTPVSGTFWQSTQPVSFSMPALTAGSALIGGTNLVDTAGVNKATVKAASTQAATADTSLVFQLNPNQPTLSTPLNVSLSSLPALTAGSAAIGSVTEGSAPWTFKPDGTAWAMTSTSANVNVTNSSIPVPPGSMALMNSGTALSFAAVSSYNGSTTVSVTGSIYLK